MKNKILAFLDGSILFCFAGASVHTLSVCILYHLVPGVKEREDKLAVYLQLTVAGGKNTGLFWEFVSLMLDKQQLQTDSAGKQTQKRGPVLQTSGAPEEKPDVEHVCPWS